MSTNEPWYLTLNINFIPKLLSLSFLIIFSSYMILLVHIMIDINILQFFLLFFFFFNQEWLEFYNYTLEFFCLLYLNFQLNLITSKYVIINHCPLNDVIKKVIIQLCFNNFLIKWFTFFILIVLMTELCLLFYNVTLLINLGKLPPTPIDLSE